MPTKTKKDAIAHEVQIYGSITVHVEGAKSLTEAMETAQSNIVKGDFMIQEVTGEEVTQVIEADRSKRHADHRITVKD